MTGAAGFLGSYLCERLLEDGSEVLAIDNLSTGNLQNLAHLQQSARLQFWRHDITAGLDVGGAVDAVLHFACPASPVDYLRLPLETLAVGSEGTRNCLDLAQAKQARFILASTSEVYGDPLEHPQTERYWGNVNPVGPRSVYDEAKRFGEALTMAYHRTYATDVGIVRIFNTYGPRMRPRDGRVVSNFIFQALQGYPLTVYGSGDQTRSFCYVEDEVEGILRLLRSGVVGPINIGNPNEFTVLELAETIIGMTGSDSSITFAPLPEDDPTQRQPDIATAQRELRWVPTTSLETGLDRTIKWFSDQLS